MEKIRKIKNSIFCCITTGDGFISGIFDNMFNTFDKLITEAEIPGVFKKILHAKQIVFFYIYLNSFFFLYKNTSINYKWLPFICELDNNKSNDSSSKLIASNKDYLIKNFLHFFLIINFFMLSILISYLKLKNWDAQFIESNAELEAFISVNRKELENTKCSECKITKVIRSFHCFYCNRCVARFELHSHWFNICVGAQNYFVYLIVLLFTNIYFASSLMLFAYQIFFGTKCNMLIDSYDFKGRIFSLHFWFILVIYAEIKILLFTKNIIKSAAKNLTDMENDNWRRFPYMWLNMRKDFFNPFDKGTCKNFMEYYVSFKNNKEMFLDKLETIKVNLNKNIDGNIKNEIILDQDIITNKNNKYDKDENENNKENYANLALNESECTSDRNNNSTLLENDTSFETPDSQRCMINDEISENKTENIQMKTIAEDKIDCCSKKQGNSTTETKLDIKSIFSEKGNNFISKLYSHNFYFIFFGKTLKY